jgi:hypothetical protein
MRRSIVLGVCLATLSGLALCAAVTGQPGNTEESDFARPGALTDWIRTSNLAAIRDNMLQLDTLRSKEPVAAFRKDKPVTNVTLEVEFRVDQSGTGAQPVGLIFGSTDSQTYHYLEIDRLQVCLCRRTADNPRIELRRFGVPARKEDEWYTARVQCSGPLIKVFYQGKLLYTVKSPELQPGLVGVRASACRAQVRKLTFGGMPVRLEKEWGLK